MKTILFHMFEVSIAVEMDIFHRTKAIFAVSVRIMGVVLSSAIFPPFVPLGGVKHTKSDATNTQTSAHGSVCCDTQCPEAPLRPRSGKTEHLPCRRAALMDRETRSHVQRIVLVHVARLVAWDMGSTPSSTRRMAVPHGSCAEHRAPDSKPILISKLLVGMELWAARGDEPPPPPGPRASNNRVSANPGGTRTAGEFNTAQRAS